MGISIVRYTDGQSSKPQWGVLRHSIIHPLAIEKEHHRDLMALFYSDRATFDAAISDVGIDSNAVECLSPLSKDIQLIAQGMNYASHRAEGKLSKSQKVEEGHFENSLFYKASSSISKPNVTIIRPKSCKLLDYEIELGIVLKKSITEETQITEENIGEYVGGLVLANDVSARDIMFGAPVLQWYKGKSQRTFCPLGPVLYLLENDDIKKIYSLRLILRLNGKVMQDAYTDQLINRPPETLTDISKFTDVFAGDCILTGTPGGILMNLDIKTGLAIVLNLNNDAKRRQKITAAQLAKADFLKPGDTLELEIKSKDGSIDLGRQVNQIADA